jgi:Arylsulfotransferase (ASST)
MRASTGKPGRLLARVGVATMLATLLQATSALGAATVVVSPLNGTPDASPDTQISFLGPSPAEISGVVVTGSVTGRHSGTLRPYATAPGASFVPAHPFAPGESVTASAEVGPKGHTTTVRSAFTVLRFARYRVPAAAPPQLSGHGLVQAFQSEPQLSPPVVGVSVNAGASPGDIFLTPTHGYGQSGAMILDALGRLVWFRPLPAGGTAADLQVESYRGSPALVWWEGRVSPQLGIGFGRDQIVDSSYRLLASVGAGNGYQADLHDFQITPQGSAYLTAYSLVSADLSSGGGPRDGILQDAIVQQVDIPTGLVMFEWHAYGHVALGDSYSAPPASAGQPWDFFHVNSISPDPWGDGDFIVSARNTWTAYEVDHRTGGVLWRLGGRHSSFRMGSGTGTAWQHDVRWQSDRTVTIFDNGAKPRAHSESRAIRLRIDWVHRTAKLVSRYTAGRIVSGSQGDDQVLANGDSFVGWGEAPYLTEFSPSGQILFNASFPPPGQSYRAFRFPWSATPAGLPAIAVKPGAGAAVTVYASWNGATGVSAWRVLAGATPDSLTPVAQAPSSGFETAVPVTTAAAAFAVQALGSEGQVLSTSATAGR